MFWQMNAEKCTRLFNLVKKRSEESLKFSLLLKMSEE